MNHLSFDSIYNYILLYLTVMSGIFALSLIATSFPRHHAYKRYRQARYAIVIGLLLTSVICFCHWFFHLRDPSAYYAAALNLGALYLSLFLFIMAFISIIREENVESKHVERNIIPSIASIIALWGGGFGNRTVRIVVVAVVGIIFIVKTSRLCFVLRKALNKYIRTREQDQQSSVNAFNQWIQRSMYWGIATGMMGIVVILVDKKVAILLLLAFAVFFCYFFVSILNYAMYFEKETLMQQSSPLSTLQKKSRKIENDIRQWINEKQYTKSKLTLNDVAHQLHTNRTYLSQYINTELNMPFGNWLSQLRLDEAKRMLVANPSLSISEAALACGFSSISNFFHLFTDLEGMTPQQWRSSRRNKGQL